LKATVAGRGFGLPEGIRARLTAMRLSLAEPGPVTRCRELEALRDSLRDPTAVAVATLYLAACRRAAGDAGGAREQLAAIDPALLERLAGDPALARLRSVAAGD
jgi:hypothetical protein